jgi:hypothetical protein
VILHCISAPLVGLILSATCYIVCSVCDQVYHRCVECFCADMLCRFRPAAALADLDDDMLEELVSSYHFGGGADWQQRGADDSQGGQRRPLTKKEVGGTADTSNAREEPVRAVITKRYCHSHQQQQLSRADALAASLHAVKSRRTLPQPPHASPLSRNPPPLPPTAAPRLWRRS